jgi:hypothetical protein
MLTDALMMLVLVLVVEKAILLMLANFTILGIAAVQQVPCCHGNPRVRYDLSRYLKLSTLLGCSYGY